MSEPREPQQDEAPEQPEQRRDPGDLGTSTERRAFDMDIPAGARTIKALRDRHRSVE